MFYGCVEEPAKEKQMTNSARQIDVAWMIQDNYEGYEQFTIVVIDSCEYLISQYDRSRMITHKGNCSFCANRNKK